MLAPIRPAYLLCILSDEQMDHLRAATLQILAEVGTHCPSDKAAAPGTPVIYAPALAVANSRTGGYGGVSVEHGLLGAVCVEMGRYWGLLVEASGFRVDSHVPGIQAAYERAMNGLLPALVWPDIRVRLGLLGGSMVLSRERLLLDVERFRMARGWIGSRPGTGRCPWARRWSERWPRCSGGWVRCRVARARAGP